MGELKIESIVQQRKGFRYSTGDGPYRDHECIIKCVGTKSECESVQKYLMRQKKDQPTTRRRVVGEDIEQDVKCPICKGERFIKFEATPVYAFDTVEFFGCTKCGVCVMDPDHLDD